MHNNFYSLLLVMFIGLKLSGYINWSWWWVLSPLWWVLTLYILMWGIALLIKKVSE